MLEVRHPAGCLRLKRCGPWAVTCIPKTLLIMDGPTTLGSTRSLPLPLSLAKRVAGANLGLFDNCLKLRHY